MSPLGMLVGMLTFGWISDKLGRKVGMVRTIQEPCSHSPHKVIR